MAILTDHPMIPFYYSTTSTYATSYEKQEMRQSIDVDSYQAVLFHALCKPSITITHMVLEPLSDYCCPNPIRSYKVKLRIVSKTKGLAVNYNETFEDI